MHITNVSHHWDIRLQVGGSVQSCAILQHPTDSSTFACQPYKALVPVSQRLESTWNPMLALQH